MVTGKVRDRKLCGRRIRTMGLRPLWASVANLSMATILMILTIYICLFLADMGAWYASGQQRYRKAQYLLPCIGGWLSLCDKLNSPNEQAHTPREK